MDSEGVTESLRPLLLSDLRLDPCQWEERPGSGEMRGHCLEVDCLVHEEWLSGVAAGHLTTSYVPTMHLEEIHWLLQPSCESVLPKTWQRVHISCIRKSHVPGRRGRRFLVPQCSGYSLDCIHEFLTEVAQENLLLSWKEILQLLQHLPEGGAARRAVTSAFVQQLVKQLYNVDLKYIRSEEDQTDSPDQNENLTGAASHSKTDLLSSSGEFTHSRLKARETGVHSNLTPLLAALETKRAFYLIYPYLRFTLFDAAIHSSAMFDDSVAKTLYVIFQLLKLLDHCHSKGITLGELSLKNVFVDTRLWVQVRLPPSVICDIDSCKGSAEGESNHVEASKIAGGDTEILASTPPHPDSEPVATAADVPSQSKENAVSAVDTSADKPLGSSFISPPPALHLVEAVEKWRHGQLSNFDYLMVLNYHAGRSLGDPNNHPMFPWVMDFTHRSSGFRDLTKSKYRITKGDRQLDFTYLSAQEEIRLVPDQDTLVPHHIGDISSDVTYYVYLARRTPKEVLCSHVRPRWVPEEYPSSIEKMYIWSPDECIPEYFVDPSIFKSIHPDLPDLEVPSWCSSPEELISVHRGVLEGEIVSSHLHHWIDLVFGYKLSGEAAVRAKNVYVSLVDKHKHPTNCGIVQLFRSSHPKRIRTTSAPVVLFEWQSYLNMSSVMNVTAFSIGQQPPARCKTESVSTELPQSPQSSDPKTLEMILSRQRATPGKVFSKGSPRTDLDRNMGDHDTTEDEIYGSYEYVTFPDAFKGGKPLDPPQSGLPKDEIGITYEDFPAVTLPSSKPTTTTPQQKESVVLTTPQSSRFRMPVVNYIFRQRKSNPGDQGAESYEWQNTEVSFPKDSNLLQQLSRLEDLGNFVNRSCKDDGGVFKEQWMPEDLLLFKSSPKESTVQTVINVLQKQQENPFIYPSFEERVAVDITAMICTVVEMCCVKQLRVAMSTNAGLLERVSTIRKLIKSGQLHLPLLSDASNGCLEVHHGDALDFDMEKLCGPYVDRRAWEDDPPNFHIVGNLPFNVSIPLLLQWLSMIPQRKGPFSFGRTQLTLTFQREVGERIKAPPCDAQRSRLSIMAQHLCHIQQGFIIRGKTFVPPPKVDAVVLKLTPLAKPRIEAEYGVLETLVKCLFQYRRKYIRKGASLLFPNHPELVPELFRLSGVDDTLRAQQLTLEQFQQLCNAYTELMTNNISDYCLENKAPEHTLTKHFSMIVDR